ncbi:glucose-6-phosphate dehydrogenase [Lacticaseibacillus pabuli]|uniref:Glucose-6-phosphate 1-dehydrogenase n=1 Tax=Lacticaseibacillus pabuli TaxID=3025672 RepID=A0ABY7WT94_9LACO|nr:glucose-6-phosphate dehydrogenase [Lacticaseibacillus sp. KACC 23028]WDF83383.1 glucose-6-phosphate dehydrogenase [Lacticaseibacillus sp. KACC 23028]
MAKEQASIITIFGGSGDLARRKLYPALYQLYHRGVLADHFAVIGTARRPWSDEFYRDIIRESLQDEPNTDEETVASFASHFYYQSHDVTDADHYITLKNLSQKLDDQYEAKGNRLFYMAMAPRFFGTIASHIRSENLLSAKGYNRLIIEKPFGRDYDSAKELNDSIGAAFNEDQVYRIDHYLGKEMVQGLLALRFTNPLLTPIWNKDYISDVQITLAEKVGVEERAGYYETAGALRDMVQNHIMQLIAYVAMQQPTTFTPEEVHKSKNKLFAHLPVLTEEDAKRNWVRGQYLASASQKGYRQEDNVDENSNIETYVAGRIDLDDPRWTGVPFFVRTGKRLAKKATEIAINFKPLSHNIFDAVGSKEARVNRLTVYVEPEQGYTLTLNGKTIGADYDLRQDPLSFRYSQDVIDAAPEAYERLIRDALRGDQTNFTRWPEQEATWKYIDVVRKAWDDGADLAMYNSGSHGPAAADKLLERDGYSWAETFTNED